MRTGLKWWGPKWWAPWFRALSLQDPGVQGQGLVA